MMTGGSTSVRAFESRSARGGRGGAGAALHGRGGRAGTSIGARSTPHDGFVWPRRATAPLRRARRGGGRADLPDHLPLRGGDANRLSGQSLPRLDVPAKVDGSARFAGDVRLPDMVYAAVRSGPPGNSPPSRPTAPPPIMCAGTLAVRHNHRMGRRSATNWWAADQGLNAINPRFDDQRARSSAREHRGCAGRRARFGPRRPAVRARATSTAASRARARSPPAIEVGLARPRRDRAADRDRACHRRPARNLGADPGARPRPRRRRRARSASPRAG